MIACDIISCFFGNQVVLQWCLLRIVLYHFFPQILRQIFTRTRIVFHVHEIVCMELTVKKIIRYIVIKSVHDILMQKCSVNNSMEINFHLKRATCKVSFS